MMEASAALSLQPCSWIGGERPGKKPGGLLRVRAGFKEEKKLQGLRLGNSGFGSALEWDKALHLKISCNYKKPGAFGHWECWTYHAACSNSSNSDSTCLMKPIMEYAFENFLSVASLSGSENLHASVDEALILKRKAEDVTTYLSGRCIYLVGMMGSGKTTVGKILSEVLGYSFFDSDKLVEQSVGMASVAQIFKERSEAFFRDSESEVLRDLSSMRRLVVATGGGAVIRPTNWRYMKQGISVWLDVPLEALARRIAAVGTASRPLLHEESGDPYTKAFTRLGTLAEQRGDAYANADARVCLQSIAAKQGEEDVCSLTPTAIAVEALMKIESFVTKGIPAIPRTSYRQAP